MPVLIIQLAEDCPEEAYDRVYREIVRLPLVQGVLPFAGIDPDVLRADLSCSTAL
jgi:hypothetical protein